MPNYRKTSPLALWPVGSAYTTHAHNLQPTGLLTTCIDRDYFSIVNIINKQSSGRSAQSITYLLGEDKKGRWKIGGKVEKEEGSEGRGKGVGSYNWSELM